MGSHDWRPRWDGHLLLLYGEESHRRAGVSAWVGRGLELGSNILYTEPPDEPADSSLRGVLADEPEALDAMERGQVEVVPAERSAYEPAFMAAVVDRALAQGYPSVRWSGDASTAWRLMPRGRHQLVERATDHLCGSRPLSVLCQYPAAESWHSVGTLSRAHSAGVREQLFQASPTDAGLAIAGDLDVSNHEVLRSLLVTTTASADGEPLLLDLAGVGFLDLAGVRALLLGTLDHRQAGGQVRLHAPQPHVAELLRLLAVDQAEGILLEGVTP